MHGVPHLVVDVDAVQAPLFHPGRDRVRGPDRVVPRGGGHIRRTEYGYHKLDARRGILRLHGGTLVGRQRRPLVRLVPGAFRQEEGE